MGPYDKSTGSSGSGSAPSGIGWNKDGAVGRLLMRTSDDELNDKDKGTGKGEGKDKSTGKYKGTGKGDDASTGKGADKGTVKGAGKDKGTGKGEDERTGKGKDNDDTGKGAGKDKGTGRDAQTKGKGKNWWSIYLQVKTARTHALMLEDELQTIEDELEAMPYI